MRTRIEFFNCIFSISNKYFREILIFTDSFLKVNISSEKYEKTKYEKIKYENTTYTCLCTN